MRDNRVLVLLAVLFFLLPGSAFAVSGDISGTWSVAQSPVMIDGDVRVPSGSSLTIEPGTVVLFSGQFSLTIEGELIAAGTDTQPVVFTRATATEASKWRGIQFVNAVDTSSLEYCVIEYVHKEGTTLSEVRGGGISISGCSPTVRHCTIRNNYTHNSNTNGAGSGVYIVNGSTSLIENNTFTNNESDSGGAVYIGSGSHPRIHRNLIENNVAHSSGGGIYIAAGAEAEISNNVFRNNTAEGWGGGAITLWNDSCSDGTCTNVYNNIIYNNSARTVNGIGFGNGGGIYCRYNASNQFNNTIYGNDAQGEGGGLYVVNLGNTIPKVTNTIIWNNSAPVGPDVSMEEMIGSSYHYISDADINYSNINGGWTGTGNISQMPLFSNPVMGYFQLLPGSGGIDAGDDSVTNLPIIDFAGNNRIVDGDENSVAAIDMGAFEYDPATPILGDLTGDRVVDLNDTILILQLLTGESPTLPAGVVGIDVNQDGVIGLAEVIFTLVYQANQL